MKRTCKWCGNEFVIPNPLSQFCSSKCGSKYQHHRCSESEFLKKNNADKIGEGIFRKTCQWCGKTFETNNIQKKNCSSLCGKYLAKAGGKSKSKWKAEVAERQEVNRKKEHICKYCGKKYFAENDVAGRSLYCSDSCKTSFLRYGCNKEEHEEFMASRDICLLTHSKYINGINVKLKVTLRSCPWCGNEFESVNRSVFCCSGHCRNFHTYGGISKEDVLRNHIKICPWCSKHFQATRMNCHFCCEKHRSLYRYWKLAIDGNEFKEYRYCWICGKRFVSSRSECFICPHCIKTPADKIYQDIDIYVAEAKANKIMSSLDKIRHNQILQEYRLLFRAAYFCSSCGMLVDLPKGQRPKHSTMCQKCSDLALLATKERLRLYCLSHREEISEAKKIYYRKHCEEIKLKHRLLYYNSEDYLAAQAKIQAESERLERLADAEERKIQEIRTKFHSVELVMLLPPEKRWEFAKDWTEEERAYAAEISSVGSVGGFFDDGDNDEILISDLDDGCI